MVAEPTRMNATNLAENADQGQIPDADVIRPSAHERTGDGLRVTRRFTKAGENPYDTIEWASRISRIANPDGSVVFEMKDAEIPASWSQVATDIMVSKYFRKAGVPQYDEHGKQVLNDDGSPVLGPERSAKQVIDRLAGCWRWWGTQYGYFATRDDARAFQDEITYMLVHQMAAPNSPQWFNTGLNYAYGITGPSQGHYFVEPESGKLSRSSDAYSRPTPHACFIQSVDDDLVGEGGIFDLAIREARVFKYGSGTGSNFSRLRAEGEPLSGGGTSSGLMSFLKVFDRAAGAIKSGGTTRRAAKMAVLDMDHPDIETFINWKAEEEKKVSALIAGGYSSDFNGEAYATVSGQNSNNSVRVTSDFMKAVQNDGDWNLTWRTNGKVVRTVKARDLWKQVAEAAWACADPGVQFDTTINDWHTALASGRINASNPCVTGDTLVATTSGYRRIADMVGGVTEVVAGDGAPSQVTRIFPTGVKPVYRLRTRSGYSLRLTADHRVLTDRGDVPANELQSGDRILLRGAGFGTRSLNPEIAEVLGVAVGDGCMTGDQGQIFVTVGKSESALAEKLAMSLAAFTAEERDGRTRRSKNVYETPTSLRVGTSAAPVRALASRYTILDQGAGEKLFTDEVFSLDQASQAAILRGLFTADGTVADYGERSQYISLDSTSLPLLEQVQVLLLSFGVKSKLYQNRLPAGERDVRGTIYNRQAMHSLRISRSSRVRFEREIGFMQESQKAAQLATLNARVTTYTDRFDDPVASVDYIGEEPVYDLTEPRTSHFVANGIVVHNCSEYMFLDDTACNLASLNLMTFYDAETNTFHVEDYLHAVRLWTIVLEISVLMAQFPSEEIARRSYIFRTLGLGYANLGSLLMTMGLPYDSEEGRTIAAALTAILTGESYAASAEMSRELGPFPGYGENREHMLRVIRNHRRAAWNSPVSEYEDLSVAPVAINPEFCPDDLLKASRQVWDRALLLGNEHGFRNAQTTLLAPTGTIGLLMDCDTTGVEPDFALVKFKKLSGGGYFKIANQSVAPALKNLGYSTEQVDDIIRYVLGTLTFDGAPHINRESLAAKGLTDEDIAKIEKALPGTFELPFAFNVWALGEEAMGRLGLTEEGWSAPGFNLLRAIGFSQAEIDEANDVICGMQTIEGAPHLKDKHLPIFDCANTCGKHGKRFIHYMGHVRMMAAAQPFLSGAISKTINMPNEATIEDIENAYHESWRLGIKAMALYRDGSKLSQPLSNKSDSKKESAVDAEAANEMTTELFEKEAEIAALKAELAEMRKIASQVQADAETTRPRTVTTGFRPTRRTLPAKRRGFTQEARVAGHKVYLRTGEYDDGQLGEIFVDLHKEGATMRSLMNCFAIAVSKGLQYGVPLQEFVDTFTFTRFEPQGMVDGHPNIKMATSIIDYVFRVVGMEYLDRTDLVQVPPQDDSLTNHGEMLPPSAKGGPPVSPPVAAITNGNGNGNGTHKVTNGSNGTGVHKVSAAATNGNGAHSTANGNGAAPKVETPTVEAIATTANPAATATATVAPDVQANMEPGASAVMDGGLSQQLAGMMGDAPFCDVCGHITVRNGACYKCLNCGNSLGCS